MTTDSGGGSGEKRNVNSAVALCAEKICTIDYEELGGYADMQECLDAAAANPTVIEIDISNCQPCNGGVNSVGGVAQPGIKAPTPVCRPGQYDIDKALTLARQMLDFNIPNFGLAFNPGQYSDLLHRDLSRQPDGGDREPERSDFAEYGQYEGQATGPFRRSVYHKT